MWSSTEGISSFGPPVALKGTTQSGQSREWLDNLCRSPPSRRTAPCIRCRKQNWRRPLCLGWAPTKNLLNQVSAWWAARVALSGSWSIHRVLLKWHTKGKILQQQSTYGQMHQSVFASWECCWSTLVSTLSDLRGKIKKLSVNYIWATQTAFCPRWEQKKHSLLLLRASYNRERKLFWYKPK